MSKFINKICDIEFDGLHYSDAPKFCDAYIAAAVWIETGEPLSDDELDELMDTEGQYVYELLYERLY